jgi:hypothetical protein
MHLIRRSLQSSFEELWRTLVLPSSNIVPWISVFSRGAVRAEKETNIEKKELSITRGDVILPPLL